METIFLKYTELSQLIFPLSRNIEIPTIIVKRKGQEDKLAYNLLPRNLDILDDYPLFHV